MTDFPKTESDLDLVLMFMHLTSSFDDMRVNEIYLKKVNRTFRK